MNTQAPQSFALIAEIIGQEAAHRLVDYAGGTSRYIPASCPPGHWLVSVVGRPAADKLCRTMPGDINIPRCSSMRKQARNASIVARFRAGESTRQIALSLHLSARGVRRIIQQWED